MSKLNQVLVSMLKGIPTYNVDGVERRVAVVVYAEQGEYVHDVCALVHGHILELSWDDVNDRPTVVNDSDRYGTVINNQVEGWCFDRDGYSMSMVIDGELRKLESTGKYVENVKPENWDEISAKISYIRSQIEADKASMVS